MDRFDLRPFPNPELLAQAAAQDWLAEVSRALPIQSPFCAALSGGRIATTFFSAVARRASTQPEALTRTHFFWSDERCVPPTDSESNFRAAQELLFGPLHLPQNQIHRIQGEMTPAEAATAAEAELRRIAPVRQGDQPVLDLVLLGMGEDGHVASLFPGESEETMASRAVFRSVTAVKPPPLRVTLGYPAIAAAGQVWVLASGAGKEAALRESLAPSGGTPLARVLRLRSSTRIYSDCQI